MSTKIGIREPFGSRIYRHVPASDAEWYILCGTHRYAIVNGRESDTIIERIPNPDELRARPSVKLPETKLKVEFPPVEVAAIIDPHKTPTRRILCGMARRFVYSQALAKVNHG